MAEAGHGKAVLFTCAGQEEQKVDEREPQALRFRSDKRGRHGWPGLSSNKTALITSDCGKMRSLSIKWPFPPRIVCEHAEAAARAHRSEAAMTGSARVGAKRQVVGGGGVWGGRAGGKGGGQHTHSAILTMAPPSRMELSPLLYWCLSVPVDGAAPSPAPAAPATHAAASALPRSKETRREQLGTKGKQESSSFGATDPPRRPPQRPGRRPSHWRDCHFADALHHDCNTY